MIKKKQRPAKLRYFILIFVSKQILPAFKKFHNLAIYQALQTTFVLLQIIGLLKKSQVKPNDVHSFRKLLG